MFLHQISDEYQERILMWHVGHVFTTDFPLRPDGIETQLTQQVTEHSEAVKQQISLHVI